MRSFDPKRHLPPGWDWEALKEGLLWGHGFSAVSLLFFLGKYFNSVDSLYVHISQPDGTLLRQLYPGRTVEPFFTLLWGMPLLGLWFFLAVMAVQVARHYRYHTRDSMSVYLMRRLPDAMEYHRRCWTVPVLASLAELLLFCLGGALCWLLWYFATPAGHLPL